MSTPSPVFHSNPDCQLRTRCEQWLPHLDDSIHYSMFQSGMRFLEHDASLLAYRMAWGRAVVLGRPVSIAKSWQSIHNTFQVQHRHLLYCYLDDYAALQLASFDSRYVFACMGLERIVCLDRPFVDTKTVRGALKHAGKHQMQIESLWLDQLTQDERDELHTLSVEFVQKSAAGKEMRFINRPFDLSPLAGVRVFKIVNKEGLVGVLGLDPYKTREGHQAYLLNYLRLKKTKQWGIYYAVVAYLSERLREEGVRELSLGLNPMESIECHPGLQSSSALTKRAQHMHTHRYDYFVSPHLEQLKIELSHKVKHRYLALNNAGILINYLALAKVMAVPMLRTIIKLIR